MLEYNLNDKIYIDIKDIRAGYHDFCKGIRSNQQLMDKKNIKSFVYGKIVENQLVQTEKLSRKFGSIFINKDELSELFTTNESKEKLETAPPVISDSDLVFFKDDDGREYNITMRGTRDKKGIYFKVKDIMYLFEMQFLNKVLLDSDGNYEKDIDYKYFILSDGRESSKVHDKMQVKEMYLTFDGLIKVIHKSKCGIAYKFKTWIDDIVFASSFGTTEQKIEVTKRVLNIDADHLKCIMDKCPVNINCIYLIDINILDDGKKVFKYGFTDNVQRRFREHMKTYGDNIKLDSFVFVPLLSLSKAETEFKNSISRYQFSSGQEKELIVLCAEAHLNVKNIFKTISEKYCGNMKEQIMYYENKMKELTYEYDMKLKEKDMEIMEWKYKYTLKDKDVELLELKLELLKSKTGNN